VLGKKVSIDECARIAGLTVDQVRHRMRRGETIEEVLASGRKPHLVRYPAFGESKTVTKWAADPRCVVSLSSLRERLANGEPIMEALTRPGPESDVPYTAFGESKSLADWARDPRCPVTENGLRGRIRLGWEIERAITKPPLQEWAIEAFGETKSIAGWSRDPRCAVSMAALKLRLLNGDPPEDAITRPRTREGRPNETRTGRTRKAARERTAGPAPVPATTDRAEYEAFGMRKSVEEWAEDPRCPVDLHTLRARLIAGMSIGAAFQWGPSAPKNPPEPW
jgi:hypothetical protein